MLQLDGETQQQRRRRLLRRRSSQIGSVVVFLPNVLTWSYLIVSLVAYGWGGNFCSRGGSVATIIIFVSDAFNIDNMSSRTLKISKAPPSWRIRRYLHPMVVNDDREVEIISLNEEHTIIPISSIRTTASEPINRRQRIRNFFRRFFYNRRRRKSIEASSYENNNNNQMLKEQLPTNVLADEETGNLHASSTSIDPVHNGASSSTTITTTSSFDYRTELEQWNGRWKIIISDTFLNEYDTYLKQLGQPYIVRSVAKNIIGATTEETSIIMSSVEEEDDNIAPSIQLRSINARGTWERTLIASDIIEINATAIEYNANFSIEDILSNYTCPTNPTYTTVITADNEPVTAESWWINVSGIDDCDTKIIECNHSGKLYHHSWLRGVTKYGGGDFESIRYLEQQQQQPGDNTIDINDDIPSSNVLVCHSIFHPSNLQLRETARVTWRFSRIE